MYRYMNYGVCDNHKEVPTCDCGMNRICRSCGFGSFSIPCECTPLPEIKLPYCNEKAINDLLDKHEVAWERLAKE